MAKPDHPHPLHRGRLERGLSIADIAASTRLPPSMVTKIDEGRFEELPAGVYARAYVRAFAAAVGVDPARVLRDLDGLLPEAPDPFPLLREIKQAAQLRRRRAWLLPRWFGATVDAAALLAINALMVRLIAYVSGLSVSVLLQDASASVAIVCAVPLTTYFVLFGGIAGRTPGAMVCRVPEAPAQTPLELRTILLRAVA